MGFTRRERAREAKTLATIASLLCLHDFDRAALSMIKCNYSPEVMNSHFDLSSSLSRILIV